MRETMPDLARDALGDVHGRGLTLQGRVGGDDDLLEGRTGGVPLGDAVEQRADAQPFGADAVHR